MCVLYGPTHKKVPDSRNFRFQSELHRKFFRDLFKKFFFGCYCKKKSQLFFYLRIQTLNAESGEKKTSLKRWLYSHDLTMQ